MSLSPLFIAAVFFLLNHNSLAIKDNDYKEEVISYLKSEMDKKKIPGLQVAVIRNNEIILSESLGLANVPFAAEVTNESLFSINSIAKVFTSTAIFQLVERNEIQISEPISRYLSGLPEEWSPITIAQLLSHTSGLPDIEDPISGDLLGAKGEDLAWKKVQQIPLQFQAGEEFSYNATNYLLLQKLIEKYSTDGFEDFIKKNQFDVAEMNRTIYEDSFTVRENKSPTYCYYYLDKVSGEYIEGEQLLEVNEEFPDMLKADSGVFSTAEDMAKWILSLQGHKFLKKKESIAQMWNPIKLSNGEYGGFGGDLNAYALGWPVIHRNKHPALAPIGGGRASFIIYPKDDLAIILFTNLSGSDPVAMIEKIATYYL
ncbi:serine hydrolase domain-containing protein [Algoriphagus sp. D3-2-R+10]|uniref:serine hydrolase domain-containing protein n=1 Tax=Algoriphagus aurantiacus TaxID=3103948 RepID=UPI002B3F94F0|nr:serine hydrolase domain-containing protein [Algoriphagus sp. D3-2-R+10]MEB2776106.1 serine hydrolase domain-containing protein [Algoriphagus sp. D3-2-R+10]